MSRGIARVNLYDLLERLRSFGLFSLDAVSHAQVEIGLAMKRIKLHRLSELVYTGIYLVSSYQAHPLPELLFRGFKGGLLDPADGTAGKGRSPYPLEYQDPDTEGYEAQSP